MAIVLPERLSWQTFSESFLQWQQGEHVVIIAPTGRGKTTLMRSLLWERDWVLVLCTKKRDETYTKFLSEGYTRAEKWPPPPPPKDQLSQHVLLWPKIRTMADLKERMPPVHKAALEGVFVDENWCLGLDDLYYLSVVCGLRTQIESLNYQTRSVGVSMVSGMQKPAWVPRSCWDQSSHAFLRPLGDIDNLRAIRGLSRSTTKELEVILQTLKPYEWLYLPVAHGDSVPPVIVKPPL